MADVEPQDVDDLMPNDGTFIGSGQTENTDQAEAEERAKIIGAQPLLKDIFEFIDAAIADADSVKNLQKESNVPLEAQVVGLDFYGRRMVLLKTALQNMCKTWGVHYEGEPLEQ